MAKRKTLAQVVMQHPIYVGGYTWSRMLLLRLLREQGMKENYIHTFITAAERTPAPAEPDTRDIPEEKAIALWRAMGDCDLAAISDIFNEFWEVKVSA